jgi:hypothetical protein
MKEYCRCDKPEREPYQNICKKCGHQILSNFECNCGQGKRFRYSDHCPWCAPLSNNLVINMKSYKKKKTQEKGDIR